MGTSNKIGIGMGLLGMAVGSIPLWSILGYLPHGPVSPNSAPDWIGVLIGLMFFFAGMMAIARSLTGDPYAPDGELPATAPPALRLVYDAMMMTVLISFAAVFSWVAFGAGTRHFQVSVMAAGVSTSTHGGGDTMGRVAFGIAAMIAWLIVVNAALSIMRRWFPQC
jgi:hypothetical protein